MVYNLTNSIQATCSRTRIFAFVVNASKAWRTIRVQNAFGSATFVRIANIVFYASASACAVLFSTESVWTTRTWWTRSWNFNRVDFLANQRALTKRITSIASQTIAHRCMTNNFALSIESASIWTRIFTFLVDASQVTRAFWVADTFRLAIRWVSDHFRQTRARCLISNNSTLSIRSTRRWLTRIWWWRLLNNFNLTSYERITSVSWRTTADWIVIADLAFGIYTTCSWARVYAFLVIASFVLRALRASDTFRSTCWRSSNVSRNTRTNSLAIDLTALWVWPTWRRLAWVGFDRRWITRNWMVQEIGKKKWNIEIHTLVRRTLNKCISTHARRTRAHRSVIDHITNSILSTCSRARINTFISNTWLIARTVIAYHTFRSTTRVRIALIFRQTSAYSVRTLWVWSAWRWVAWIITWRFFGYIQRIKRFTLRKDKTDMSEFLRGGGLA